MNPIKQIIPTPKNDSPNQTKNAQTPANQIVGDIKIDNVNKSLWQYIKKKKLVEALIVVPFVIIWEIFVIYLFVKYLGSTSASGNTNSGGKGFVYLMMLPVIIISSWVYKLKKQFEEAFLEEFAEANNYNFDKDGIVDKTYGSIFRLQGQQTVSDVVTGTYHGSSLRLFLYELVIGYGRNQQRFQDTVIELDLKGKLPPLLMSNKRSRFRQLNLTGAFGIKNTVKLEGDFDKYFTLYAPQGNELEALEVFSPDTMALMEDESKHYSVEFAGNRIYIYSNGLISTTESITQVFALAKKLIDKIGPLANRLENDSAVMPTPINLVKMRGQYHKNLNKIIFGTSILFFIFIFGITSFTAYRNARNSPQTSSVNSTTINSPSNNVTNDVNSVPFCGAEVTAGMPQATIQYINAIEALNSSRDQISNAIVANGKTSSQSINDQQLQADKTFLSQTGAISFPANAQADAQAQRTAIENYDSLITKEFQGNFTTSDDQALATARSDRTSAGVSLRADLGIPPSTCSFYEP